MITALLLSAVTATATPSAVDDGWLAWYGCWRAQGDASSTLLCVVPTDNGVRMASVVDGKIKSETLVVADGVPRTVEREGCKGTEWAKWSKDMQRVFLTSDLMCGKVQRKTTGIIAMSSPTQWIDVESVSSGDQTLARTVRYTSAYAPGLPADIVKAMESDKLARETSRYAATAALNLDDVAEAAHTVDEHAVTEFLTAMNQQFDLTGKKLVALADNKVSPTIIDVLVAVSNPELFAVRNRVDDRGRRTTSISADACFASWYQPWAPSYYNRYYYDRCRDGIGGYGYGYGGYYGYNGYYGGFYPGYAGGWYPVGSTVVVVRDNENPNARVTRNGYSRGSSTSTGSSTGTTSRQPSSTSASPSTPSGSSGEGSGGGGGTRTAHPRNN